MSLIKLVFFLFQTFRGVNEIFALLGCYSAETGS